MAEGGRMPSFDIALDHVLSHRPPRFCPRTLSSARAGAAKCRALMLIFMQARWLSTSVHGVIGRSSTDVGLLEADA